jgi:hypothetical protein
MNFFLYKKTRKIILLSLTYTSEPALIPVNFLRFNSSKTNLKNIKQYFWPLSPS